MNNDDFTTAARAEARKRVQGDSRFAHTTRDLLVGMAAWARDHLAAQEPTDAEVVKARAEAWDEGAQAQADTYGGQVDTGPNPYRTEPSNV